MAEKTFDELLSGAQTIRDNELPESNTHTLVGEQLVNMVDKIKEEDSKLAELSSNFAKEIYINADGGNSVSTNLFFKESVKYIIEISSDKDFSLNFIIGEGSDYYITITGNTIIEFTPSKSGYARCYFFNAFNGSIFFNVKRSADVNDKLEGNMSYNHYHKTYYIIKEYICLNDIDIYIISRNKNLNFVQLYKANNDNEAIDGTVTTLTSVAANVLYKVNIPASDLAKKIVINSSETDNDIVVFISKNSNCVYDYIYPLIRDYDVKRINITQKTITYTLDRLNLSSLDNIFVDIKGNIGTIEWIQFIPLKKDETIIDEFVKTIYDFTSVKFYYLIPPETASIRLNVASAEGYKYDIAINKLSNVENDIIQKVNVNNEGKVYYSIVIDAYADGEYINDTNTKFYGVDKNGKNAIQRAIESTTNINGKKLIRCHGSFIANKLSDFTVENSTSTSPDYIYHSFVSVNGYKDITLMGDGKNETFIIGDLTEESSSFEVEKYQTVQAEADGLVIEDLTIIGKKVRYPVHIDKSGTGLKASQRLDNTTQIFNRVNIIAKGGGLGHALGVGIASGQKIICNDCYIKSYTDTAAYYHDGRPFTISPLMQFNRCRLESEGNKLFTGQVSGAVVPCYVEFNRCTYNNYEIFVQDAAIDFGKDYDYRKNMRLIVNGAGNSPAKYAPELRTKVLKITADDNTKDVTFNTDCSAFDVLIKGLDIQYKELPNGIIYENSYARRNNYAYGLKTISCVNYFTMKDILGNRSSSAIELIVIIGSESITIPFNKDYSEIDDDTIIDEINSVLSGKAKASLTADNIEVYQNFSDAFLPLRNTSSEYIEKGYIVQKNGNGIGKYKGLGNIYGIALDDLRTGQIGNILIKGIVGKLSSEVWGINSDIQKGKYLTTDDSGTIQLSDTHTNIYCIDDDNVIIAP